MPWISLHTHSQYSILSSTASVQDLALKAKECGMPYLALTDGNLFGAVDFYKACKAASVKPIIGSEIYVAPGSRLEKKKMSGHPHGYPIVLLAIDKEGYRNLCLLSSLAHIEGFYYTPRIDKELLQKHHAGLLALSGGIDSYLAQCILRSDESALQAELEWCLDVFGDRFYLEVQRHCMSDEAIQAHGLNQESWLYQKHRDLVEQEERVIKRFKEISQERGIPCVATNDIRYLGPNDWKAQEILMNIQSGETVEVWEKDSQGNPKNKVPNPKREVLFSHEYFFKTPEQMATVFADFPEAIENTLLAAKRCVFEMDFKTKYYPVYTPPHLEGVPLSKEERAREADNYLRKLCEEAVPRRYTAEKLKKVQEKYPGKNPLDVVLERLKYELDLIIPKGMCDYLLIVYDFIDWAKRSGIPMGPGRGSGVGSIILYLIGITDIEPLRFNLFFERFINPERISYPDIDVDICMDRRSEVIDYTVRKYGQERVAQIITFGTMKAKMAIKDVGRVLNVPLVKVNAIAKLVPDDLNITIAKSLEIDPEFRRSYETDPEIHSLIDLAQILEGSVRNTGIHAAGLIISSEPLADLIPICTAKDSTMAVTQYSMKSVEAVGGLKIDFLGLKTLTSIQLAVDEVKESCGVSLDWVNLPLDDPKTFSLLNQGKTLGIFQLESGGMQELAKQLHIDKFEEIIAVGSLYRPGPMEMIPSFIQRKHGKEEIEIDHPLMKDILAETYGIMVYQEQVMQIASRLANYSLGEGDVLRRAMGKKDHEEMARQREKFRQGALKNNIDEVRSMHIFDKVEKFASYGFNKSHATAYAYLSYVTAYLKANYSSQWMAALMTSDRDDITKLSKIIRESQSMGIAILPPDINESAHDFIATSQGIRFAMAGIKGVGEGVVETILLERKKNGPFASLYDFFKRIDTSKVGKKVVETLIEAGCFDCTGWGRDALLQSVDQMYEIVVKEQKESARGVLNLFSLIEDTSSTRFAKPPVVLQKRTKQQNLKRENELLGLYLTGHPLDEFRSLTQRLSCLSLQRLRELDAGAVCRTMFIINTVSIKLSSKNQRKFAILTIGDDGERYELPIWSELFEEKGHLIAENQLVYAVVQIDKEDEGIKLQCRWLDDLTKVDEAMIRACDQAYERAKMNAKMQGIREKKNEESAKAMKKAEPPKPQRPIKLIIDANSMRLSHVLELKKLFRNHSGKSPVKIEFTNQKRSLGVLSIDAAWGITLNEQIVAQLQQIPCVRNVMTEPGV